MAKPRKTPVRAMFRPESALRPAVLDGLQAVEPAHREHLEPKVRSDFEDSLDLDAALRPSHQQEHRWDYLLGHGPSGEVVALEPHSANSGEVSVVIKKKAAALVQLRDHARNGARVSRWIWVSSGKIDILNLEKARQQLDQSGIALVPRVVLAKHLPSGVTRVSPKLKGRKHRKKP